MSSTAPITVLVILGVLIAVLGLVAVLAAGLLGVAAGRTAGE